MKKTNMKLPCQLLDMSSLLMFTVLSVLQMAVADVSVSVNPAQIDVGLSSSLDVNCTVSLNGSSVVGLISILVSREPSSGGNLTELATVTGFSVNLVSDEGLTVDGAIDKQSYIHLHWDYPTEEQTGVYHCTAEGMDFLGHIVSLNNVAVVGGNQPDIVDVIHKIQEMEKHLSDADNYNKYLEQQITEMHSYNTDLEQRVAEVEVQNEAMQKQMLEMQWSIANLENTFVKPPLDYKGSKYYLSNTPFMDFNDTINYCKNLGGFIVEIDDWNEYIEIQRYLNETYDTSHDFYAVSVGGTDEAIDGEWVLPSSNQPLPVAEWYVSQPSRGYRYNCMLLYVFTVGWLMVSSPCHPDEPTLEVRFMCEIPNM